jgi:triacylglycerol lipase
MITPKTHTPLLPGTLKNLFYPPEADEYTYFARAAQSPFKSGGAIVKAAWAADAAMLAYARYGATRMTTADLTANFGRGGLTYQTIGGSGGNWNASGTQAVFAGCDDFAILAFRGTEIDDAKDKLYDADIILVPEHDYRPSSDPSPALGHFAAITHLFSSLCLVHHGFQSALNEVWEDVHRIVLDYRGRRPGAEIRFTGHSLGAALAVLAYSRFADPDLSLCTFGCPRTGDGAFRDRVKSNSGRGIYRFVNFNDVVAHIPLESLLYKHAPEQCYRFDNDGNLDTGGDTFSGDLDSLRAAIHGLPGSLGTAALATPAPPSFVDHSPARYCMRAWDCV